MTEQQEFLVTNNLRLAYHYMRLHKIDIDEHIDIFYEALVKAACGFDSTAGSHFSTYAFKVFDSFKSKYADEIYNTRNQKMLSATNSKFVYLNDLVNGEESLNSFEDIIEDKKDFFESIEESDQFNSWRQKITGKRKQILDMLISGMTYEKMSQELHITKQRISAYKIQLERNYKHYCKTGTVRNIKGESTLRRAL